MQKISLSARGTPSSGPSGLRLERRCAEAFAAAPASSVVRRRNACSRPSTARIRASDASSSASGDTAPEASASEICESGRRLMWLVSKKAAALGSEVVPFCMQTLLPSSSSAEVRLRLLGTRNACPSCCGDCESTFSRGRHGRGSSARMTTPACASPAKPRGSTPLTSTACSRSMYSSTCASCAAKRSSSSGDNARRARRATCLTWARSMATVLLPTACSPT